MKLVLNIVFKDDTAETVLEHLRNKFPNEQFYSTVFLPGMQYIVHETEVANQAIIDETYRIADLIYDRNGNAESSLLLRGIVRSSPLQLQLWEPNENQAKVSECIEPLPRMDY